MKIIDTNILVYAVNQDDERCGRLSVWLELVLNSDEPIGFHWITLLGFIRISTHPNIFLNPLSIKEAIDQTEAWLECPCTRLIRETSENWTILQELLLEAGTAGNLTTDAHLAALSISRGATLVSCDTDFARFKRLRWENPLVSTD